MTKNKLPKEIEKYSIRVRCVNCDYGSDYDYLIDLPKGIRLNPNYGEICPNCKCRTLKKANQ